MKKRKEELRIHCFFTKEGENPQELIYCSLRFFIEKNLRNHAIF